MPPEIAAMLKDCPALAEGVRSGIDIPLLLDNLKLSYSERISQLQAAADLVEKLQHARNI
ncbi:MAG: hypothetical protein FJ263_06360 [Planctomycetes bacterium]|nr:hypothetical protein [Planctomycetota bacterium]